MRCITVLFFLPRNYSSSFPMDSLDSLTTASGEEFSLKGLASQGRQIQRNGRTGGRILMRNGSDYTDSEVD